MNKPANPKRVLALDVRPRSFGYAVFEGPTLLLDWGVQSFRHGRNAVRIPLGTKIAALLEDFQPAVVVAKEPPSRKKVNRGRTRKILELVRHKASQRGIRTRVFQRRAASKLFGGEERPTKHKIASVLAVYQGYGCTELSPVVAVETAGHLGPRHTQPGHKVGTVGQLLPGVAARIVDPDTGRECGPNQEGMLLVKGPNVMMGYLGDAEKTLEVMCDGWYVTGDIAKLDDDGFITITDRLSRFSKIGGEMVPHLLIEDALHKALGAVEQTMVVIGVPDEQKGEKLIVLHTALEVTVDELLKRLCDANLPKLWLPRKQNFFPVEALPWLGVGKLDLKQVKEIAQGLSAAVPSSSGETG